ncbi:type II secretion system F family protein [Ornithinimicrobium avium]|uniref:Type II secretion system protein GspF domain-containing protein n=1 Tax=Ornithinimicrobium avium TaxID=2283195 RepID=A0A345NQ34_9MICO|nr:type II secretion system F family protein [Ornithinimicrobium avium]AXH97142.1 hypothetical protein DV701_14350 [Ornithinimicrobium avium]
MTGTRTVVLVLLPLVAAAAVLLWPAGPRPAWTPAGRRRGARGRWRPGRAAGAGHRAEGDGPAGRGLVAEALELVALALAGGGSLVSAVAWVAQVLPGATGERLAEVAARLGEGVPVEQAWEDAGEQWAPAVRSLRLAEGAGVPPGEALTRAAADLRREAVGDVEVGAAKLGVRLVLPLGLAYLPAFVLTTVVPVVLALTRDLVW